MAHATPLSRRALLAISAAAAAGTATGAALAPVNPDAELLGLCAEWEELRREFWAACSAQDDAEEAAHNKHPNLEWPQTYAAVHSDPDYKAACQRTQNSVKRSHSLFHEIAQARAVTLQGVMAKARVTLGECLEGIDAELVESTEGVVPGFMAISLVRDLLAMHSAGEA